MGRPSEIVSLLRRGIATTLAQAHPNRQLITNPVPELAFVVGEQSPVVDLPPHDAQDCFQMFFRRSFGEFARKKQLQGCPPNRVNSNSRKAKASTAYKSALNYFSGRIQLLGDNLWENQH
jgi:predicted ATPase